ncbi:phosphonatase-like hydrolase [Leifsonia sp. NPDC058230]|uniref:phosphonatase-like hydrolase n=1 Tax=Leifsonia sp. NPDC058230 TaxID=3346391 RepID=UPI0036DD9405
MTTRDGLITSEFDDAATFDDVVPFDDLTDLTDVDRSDEDDWEQEEEEDDDLLDVDLELVVLDMAGTTVEDDGLVERAFERAALAAGIGETADDLVTALAYVRETMGQSKISVFRALTGDEDQAQHANAEFESAYADLAAAEGLREIPGAEHLIRRLRSSGVKVALTTGFSQPTKDAVLDALGWRDLVDVTLSPAEAGRGRPYPDLPLTALLRTGATSVEGMVVVGDTASDIISGIAAGAGLVVGVLSGAHDEETLLDAGADAVIASVAELPALLGFDESPESLEALHARDSDGAAVR